ncbi:monocarboxylate transporter 11-like isoform X3 [Argopecten irradians]|uniref:monocarboxylate transporter 11-like isoform X3 n=1 Tax=Argopecten irradians TaxID=31199 RepID=UPI0037209DFC
MVLTKPDSGWAWVVMMAAFSIFVINGFLCYGYGMVQIALLDRFHDSIAKTSLVGSLYSTFLSCGGVCDGLLIRRYSCRLVAVAGGLLMTIGMFVSAFMTSLDWIIFTFGVVGGVSSLLLPTYSDTFTGQFVFAVIFGLYGGCLYAVINGITLRYLPLRDLGTAVGIELAVVGIAIMTGPPAIGLIIDATRNYDIGLVIAGLCLLLGAVLTLVAESCNNKRPQNNITSLNTELASLTVDIPAPSEDTDICEHTI